MGMFNQILAIYIILGQLAPIGLHMSVLSFLPKLNNHPNVQRKVFSSALSITIASALIVCLCGLLSIHIIGKALGSELVERGIIWALPGLWCFAVNKVLLGALNGARHMRMYAFAQSMRVVTWIAAMYMCVLIDTPIHVLPVVLTIGDVLLLLVIMPYSIAVFGYAPPKNWNGWLSYQFHFGRRVMFSGLMMDINTKADVLMLGIWCSDHIVGIYSFASMFIEGLAQIPGVLRENINPLISNLLQKSHYNQIKLFIRRVNYYTVPGMTIIVLCSSLVYSWFSMLVTGNPDFADGQTVFIILGAGLSIGSGFIPFHMLLNQSGHPQYFTGFVSAVVASNIVLNAILIPLWQDVGAAIATAIAFFFAPIILIIFSRIVLKQWII
jgi:O-antigen/teichoic acid export membrane protein